MRRREDELAAGGTWTKQVGQPATADELSRRPDRACRSRDPDLFFAAARGDRCRQALKVCQGCRIRQGCLEVALALPTGQDIGVWGGTSEHARRQIRAGRLTRSAAMARGDQWAAAEPAEDTDEPARPEPLDPARACRSEPWL